MIKVEVKYIIKPNQREAFYDSIVSQGIDVASKNESGNAKYDFEIPANEKDILYLHELWSDDEALASHSQKDHYKSLAKLKEKYVIETIIEKEVEK